MAGEVNEKTIKPPKNPLTVRINLAILGFYFESFAKRWFPTFGFIINSSYRTEAQNKAAGGATNSGHLHGLAYDFILTLDGKPISKAQAKKVFDEFIAPNWAGFALFENEEKAPGYHIHVNLSREVTTYAGMAGVAALGMLGFAIVSNWSAKK